MSKVIVAVIGLCASLLVTACGESSDDSYARGYDEGYEYGAWEVCAELKGIAPAVKDELDACEGF